MDFDFLPSVWHNFILLLNNWGQNLMGISTWQKNKKHWFVTNLNVFQFSSSPCWYTGVEDITWLGGEIYNNSLQVLEDLSLFRFAHSLFLQHGKRNFVSPRGHVQSCNEHSGFKNYLNILITRNKCYMHVVTQTISLYFFFSCKRHD